jgi:surface protein
MKKTLFLSLLFHTLLFSTIQAQNNPFITRWNLSKIGSGSIQISFDATTSGTVNYTWQEVGSAGATGSGTFTGGIVTITGLPSGAIIDLSIQPTNFSAFAINYGVNRDRLIDIRQWGNITWTSMESAFSGCSNLNITATDTPNLAGVANTSFMFHACSSLNSPANINSWNTATVTNMSGMFMNAFAFNQNIGAWNTAAVTNMSYMFYRVRNFNQNISSWNTAVVTNMSEMFWGASAFNQNIGAWNTAAVTNMNRMFYNASAFNQNIGTWNTAAVTDMSYMFFGANVFNQNIGTWNTAAVTNMSYMFVAALAFNQNIGTWNTTAVTNMESMFVYALAFNQNIGTWNTANVTNMHGMFDEASSFNQNIGAWNTAAVTDMNGMFFNSRAFNQNIGSWNTTAVMYMASMFYGASAFNQNIGTWNTANVTNMSYMFNRASAFNQNIGSWNTTAVTNMSYMFNIASAFNQNISSWNIANTTDMTDIFNNSGINVANYDAILSAWNTAGYTNKNLGDASPLKYCASTVRTTLTTPIANGGKGWTITGDALNSVCTCALNTSQATGNWGTASTWSCGHVPLATEPVQIAPGHTLTLDVNGTAKSLDLRGIINKQATKILTIQGN